MSLTRVEKERITDSFLKIRSVADSLTHVDPSKVPSFEDIQDCLDDAQKSLSTALKSETKPPESKK